MKKTFRLTALVMALLMLVNISASATTNGIPVENLKMADWSNMLQTATQAAQKADKAVEEYWIYISQETPVHPSAHANGSNATIPENTWVTGYGMENEMHKVQYLGETGYIQGSGVYACTCENASITDPATHIGTCAYYTYFMNLAIHESADALLARWAFFSSGEQAFVLDYLKANMPDKYAAVCKLENVNKTEQNITSNGGDENAPSVNAAIKVPEGAFEEDYIMNAAASVLNDQQQQALNTLQLWRQLAVFDISFETLADGSKLQPSVPVQLTFTVDVSNIHGNTLHVHHLKDNGDGTYTAESLGTVAVDKSQTTQTIAVNCPSFSAITVSDECGGSICCMYNDEITFSYHTLMAQPGAEERWNYLNERYEAVTKAADETAAADTMATFMAHLGEVHSDCLSQLCQCDTYPIPAVGDASHAADCPWSAANQQNTHVFEGTDGNGQFFDPDTDMSIYVPDDAFTNNAYTVQATPVFALDEAQQEAVAALDNTHVFAAFDVSFLGSDGATAPATPVDLTFVVNSTGNLVGSHLVIHCLQKSGDDTYTVRKLGETELDYQAASLIASAQCSVFPGIITLSYACDGSACGFNTIMNAANAAEREAALRSLVENDEYYIFTMCAETFHYDETNSDGKTINDLICLCYGYPDDPDGYAYGSLNHETECYKYGQDLDDDTTVPCPWHFSQLSLVEQKTVVDSITDPDEKAEYIEAMGENAEKLDRINATSYTVNDGEYGVTVNVPDGAVAKPYLLEVKTVADDVQTMVTNAVNESLAVDTPFTSLASKSFDICFQSLADGTELVPSADVTLTFSVPVNEDESVYELRVYHMDENADGTYKAEKIASVEKGIASISISTTDFSIYSVDYVGDTNGTRINANSTVDMPIGETRVFYWIKNNNNAADNYTWVVENGEGIVDWTVYGAGSTETNPEYGGWENESYPFIKVTAKAPGTITVTMKYYYNRDEREEIFYINVPAQDFYIEDQIAENGSIVPAGTLVEGFGEDVTYTWSRSDGETIKAAALLDNNGVNVAVDRGGITEENGAYVYVTYTVTAKDGEGNELAAATYTVPYGNEILNSSFETPELTSNTHIQIPNGTEEFFWKTTGIGTGTNVARDIELIETGDTNYGVLTADHGDQFAEVNAEAFGTLYQDLLTAPGATLTWSFSHAARHTANSVNTLYIVMASTEEAENVVDANDVNTLLNVAKRTGVYDGAEYTATIDGSEITFRIWKDVATVRNSNYWQPISGSYTVPEGQYLTRLFFASETTGNYSTLGNLIDKTGAYETLTYKIEYYINGELQSKDTQTGIPSVYSYVRAEKLEEYLAAYALTGATINGQPYPADVQAADFAGFYIAPYVYSSGDDEYVNIFRLYFKDEAITVTKRVNIDNWSELNARQQQALIADYKATFGLYKADESETLISTVEVPITYTEGQDLLALAEFTTTIDGEPLVLEETTYTVKELSATELTGYTQQTTYENGSANAPTVTITQTERTFNVNCLNSYVFKKGALTIRKDVVDSSFPATGRTFTFVVKPLEGQDITNWLAKNTQYVQVDGGFAVALPVSSSKTATISLSGLPAGRYEVIENADEEYSTTYKVGDAAETTVKAVATVIQDGEVVVLVTNTHKTSELTIRKQGVDEANQDDVFVFKITDADLGSDGVAVVIKGNGSATIAGLKVGAEYTVTEVGYSFRYTNTETLPADGKVQIKVDADQNVITFTNSLTNDKWLDSDFYVENTFTGIATQGQ